MRRTASERLETIRMVEESDLSARSTLRHLGVARSTFYDWYKRFVDDGPDGLEDNKPTKRRHWNRVPQAVKDDILALALKRTDLSARELAVTYTDDNGYFVSESTVYRLLKAHDLITSPAYILLSAKDAFENPTQRVHELWQTDFTHFRIVGWGWYYLSTVLDDFSRYIIAWKLSPTMATTDVKETLDAAIDASGVDQVQVHHRPRLLSDNGPAYVSSELRSYLEGRGMTHTRGAPYHPMTQGKIERYHRSMKNVVKLENYYFPGQLEEALTEFVDYYNNRRFHESLNNVTPADVYFGRHHEIVSKRQRIKRLTMRNRKRENLAA